MTVDLEQVRRDDYCCRCDTRGHVEEKRHGLWCWNCNDWAMAIPPSLLAELEQAKRERDEAREERDIHRRAADAAERQLGAIGAALGEPCAECGHVDWRSDGYADRFIAAEERLLVWESLSMTPGQIEAQLAKMPVYEEALRRIATAREVANYDIARDALAAGEQAEEVLAGINAGFVTYEQAQEQR